MVEQTGKIIEFIRNTTLRKGYSYSLYYSLTIMENDYTNTLSIVINGTSCLMDVEILESVLKDFPFIVGNYVLNTIVFKL